MNHLVRRHWRSFSVLALALAAACAGIDSEPAFARSPEPAWPPAWHQGQGVDFSPIGFEPPSAAHCNRLPGTREVPGGRVQGQGRGEPMRSRGRAAGAASPSAEMSTDRADAAPLPAPAAPVRKSEAPMSRQAPSAAPVKAGMVDDNADFTEYLAYRMRHGGQGVRDRDVSERYRLDVVDPEGRPVHDAEVAVQRAGVAEPVAWARTDTSGRVWLHPRAFLAPEWTGERSLGIAVRKNGVFARGVLERGQAHAVRVTLQRDVVPPRPRLDLVFVVDATGSMGDEIAKLKASMHAMAQQISRLPGQPDICYGLVAYRDRGDAFLTRTHDFTDQLGAFQQVLDGLQAGGGGDTPEALDEALNEAVHRMSWRTNAVRVAVLVADAPPHLDHGGPQYDRDMQAALAKGVKIFAVGASGLDPAGEYVFRQMAQYTAGRFVFLTYQDPSNPSAGAGERTVHDVRNYSVQSLDRLVVRLVSDEMAALQRG